MAEPPAIELQDVRVAFGAQEVLRGFSLAVRPGEKLSLVGESSSGKSTLLKAMVGLIAPQAGTVRLFGRDLAKMGGRELRAARQRVGMQFQSGALFDSMSVLENLALARSEAGRATPGDRGEITRLLAQVGLAKAADRPPFALSGGMRKRAALARAITTDPDVAIFDEPTAGLDPVTSSRIINLIGAVSAQSGAAMLLATTDIEVARRFSPELVILNEGRLWARGPLEKLRASGDGFTRRLLGRLL